MGKIKTGRMVLGAVATNCYFVYDTDKMEAVVFDPADQGAEIFRQLQEQGITVAAIFLTHGHFDHIMGVAKLRQLSHTEVYAAAAEAPLLGDERLNCSAQTGAVATVTPDHPLEDGETVEIAGMKIKMLLTPGHTAGSCCYYIEEENLLISGDTLFESSVGRTDLPTGSMGSLVRSVREKLFVLPEQTVVYPGHGDQTTIAAEIQYNPYV